ncbi:MAG TPA: endonuclease III domain-containing protein [Phycisphaerae bacterium]|nr:endonuclease III domain-containing protein [Phycisphaerae bacterium]
MYEAMRAAFGHRAWWPGETPLEICVGAILTQNTNWRNVEKALANLKHGECLSLAALDALPLPALAELIRPAGYYNVKARRLKNFVAAVREACGDNLTAFLDRSVPALREALLAVRGIGRETADSIILYAAGKCSFVVDAYTYRVLLRHGLIAPEDDYEAIKELFESALPADAELWNDYHAQLVEVGKRHCRPVARCEGCPLEKFPHDAQAGTTDG